MSEFDSDIIDREKKYTIPLEEIKRINDVDNILQYFNDKVVVSHDFDALRTHKYLGLTFLIEPASNQINVLHS